MRVQMFLQLRIASRWANSTRCLSEEEARVQCSSNVSSLDLRKVLAILRAWVFLITAMGWVGAASASLFVWTPDRVVVFGAGSSGLSDIPIEVYSAATGESLGAVSGRLTTRFEDVAANGYDFVLSDVTDPETGLRISAGIDFRAFQYFGVDGDGLDVYALFDAVGDPLSAMLFRVNLLSGLVLVDSGAEAVRFDRITSSVPEPSTLCLAMLGLLGVVGRRLRCAA
jgi:hypothetical protein